MFESSDLSHIQEFEVYKLCGDGVMVTQVIISKIHCLAQQQPYVKLTDTTQTVPVGTIAIKDSHKLPCTNFYNPHSNEHVARHRESV